MNASTADPFYFDSIEELAYTANYMILGTYIGAGQAASMPLPSEGSGLITPLKFMVERNVAGDAPIDKRAEITFWVSGGKLGERVEGNGLEALREGQRFLLFVKRIAPDKITAGPAVDASLLGTQGMYLVGADERLTPFRTKLVNVLGRADNQARGMTIAEVTEVAGPYLGGSDRPPRDPPGSTIPAAKG